MSSADLAWYEELREAYRPGTLRLLLIGESPPDPGAGARRFFYAPNLTHDNLYRGVVAALYGDKGGFDPSRKTTLLEKLRDDGVGSSMPSRSRSTSDRHLRADARSQPQYHVLRVGSGSCAGRRCDHLPQRRPRAHGTSAAASGARVLHSRSLPFPLGNWRAQFVDGVRAALVDTSWSRSAP